MGECSGAARAFALLASSPASMVVVLPTGPGPQTDSLENSASALFCERVGMGMLRVFAVPPRRAPSTLPGHLMSGVSRARVRR